ncbi:heavy metal translocating P-type ATPase [Chengkuizengella axinellae]|uniref:Heavy metal translocating P-type ATPase n=1 Tax=Chengkuizengella axinellae TaxID=3064388 RepID=A0ABT9ITJ0_9BACL|nr:heavy metal translocating P-type ATPase [Chengkuizengella sp. 2205SS18-9]MDP5272602.1 heavy metal translocating P-type ATPase [Chengkuizengella sp. 2205SS18-9]
MNVDLKALSEKRQSNQRSKLKAIYVNLIPHIQLIAALLSGVFIVTGWILSDLFSSTAIMFFVIAYLVGGYQKAKEGILDTIKDRNLNVEMLMIFAAIGSAIIGYWMEGAILIFIFSLSGALETYTMNRSNREISALMELQPEEALIVKNGTETKIHVSMLVPGDEILVKPGERMPADGFIIRGQSTVDQSAITGESLPVQKKLNDEVFSGTVNLQGSITIKVTKLNKETLFQKIIQLVQTAQSEKSPSQLFIDKFEGIYVKVVIAAVSLMMFIPHYVLDWTWNETIYRAMILLVVASPCALVASITPATLSAISNGAKLGILFKGGVHIEGLSKIRAIALDKTGTLTKGEPEITDLILREGISQADFLIYTASIENHSTHPLAQAIVNYTKLEKQLQLLQPDFIEDIPGRGVTGKVSDREWKIGNAEFVGDDISKQFLKMNHNKFTKSGKTLVFIADYQGIVGVIALKDRIREQSKEAIHEFNKLGIYTFMLTGDDEDTARTISKEMSVDGHISRCLPEDKLKHVKELKKRYENVAMVGDGINDAPALASANLGIAMGTGTDVALETADIILMKNDLSKIPKAIYLSKKMNRVIKQNIVFSLAVIGILICSNFLQILDLPYGVIGHEGSTILVILNGLRLLKLK